LDGELNSGHLAPLMIELDPTGKVVNSWGDPNLIEGTVVGRRNGPIQFRLHTRHFDPDNNVWIASSPDGMIQKYTHDGRKLLQQIGRKGVFDTDGTIKGAPLNSNAARFTSSASIQVDRQNGDIYIADGESRGGNSRVLVLDANDNFLRQWRITAMDSVHSMAVANDAQSMFAIVTAIRYGSTTGRGISRGPSITLAACDRARGRQDRAERRYPLPRLCDFGLLLACQERPQLAHIIEPFQGVYPPNDLVSPLSESVAEKCSP